MVIKNCITGWILALVICVFPAQSAAGRIIYVNADANGANNGTSWLNAHRYLQDALAAASSGDEIWVAEGIYKPDQGGGNTPGNREATFQLINGVAIKGGYAGFGQPDPNTRDPNTYETILSGDLNGDDVEVSDPRDLPWEPTRAENSYHVVTGNGTDKTAVLDGFTITAGNANGSYPSYIGGGGMYNEGSPTLANCTFSGNSAYDGGGMYNYWSSPTLTNCTFSRNSAGRGGGMANSSSSPTLTNCTFSENSADGGGGVWNSGDSNPTFTNCKFSVNSAFGGGGVWNSGDSNPTFTNCKFSANFAGSGGGMENYESSPTVTNCIFSGNSAGRDGGGMDNYQNSSPTVTNCTFSGNTAGRNGGGMDNYFSSNPTVTNCILWGDSAPSGPEIFNINSTPSVAYSDIAGGYSGTGNIDEDPLFIGPNGPDGIPGTADDNIRLSLGSPCIDVGDNTAVPAGVTTDLDGNPRIRNGIVDMGAYEYYHVPVTIYVDASASTGGNGQTWATAYKYLQDALYKPPASGDEIRVAQGIYKTAGNRFATFHLINGVAIRGGYAGFGEPDPNARDIDVYETVLSGDLAGNDGPDFANNDENSYHVVTGSGTNATAILDGFTITAGNANGGPYPHYYGGGMYNYYRASPTITNCTFSENSAKYNGGGMYNDESSPTLTDCTFIGNSAAWYGGGMCNDGEDSGGNPILTNCVFIGNSAVGAGGGMSNTGSPTLTNCVFSGNTAESFGGGMDNDRDDGPCNPILINCTFSGNSADDGGGMYSGGGTQTLTDCTFSGNSPDGVQMYYCEAEIVGYVLMVSNDWVVRNSSLIGDGTLQIDSNSTLRDKFSEYPGNVPSISCNLAGTGTVQVDLDTELIIEGDAVVDLTDPCDPGQKGRIQCDGLLRVRDNAQITNANINVTRASFEGDVNIFNSVITAEAGAPYGQFFIEGTATIIGNDIHADGDRYMDLEPAVFDGLIANNRIFVKITEGVGQTRGGLLELRGLPDLATGPVCDPNNIFFCHANSVPPFDVNNWMLEELKLIDEAKVNLTNRFDFQPPYDANGDKEALYVRNLILGKGSVINTSFNKIYYENLIREPNSVIKNVPLLGFSLNNIAFDNDIEFITRVTHNNFIHPEDPCLSRIHVARVEGLEPDPNGMMQMCNLIDQEQGQVVNARARGLFARCNEDVLLIWFEYLFETSAPNVELAVYLTDVPELLDHNDPARADHYIEVARLAVPPPGRPGSAGSGRFGVFHEYVWRDDLDFLRGTRIELELIGPDGACVLINNWDPQVHCSLLYCGDVTGDHGATVLDFLTVVAHIGSVTGLLPGGAESLVCLEFGWSADGVVDALDVAAWSWRLNLPDPLNLCEVPLAPVAADTGAAAGASQGVDSLHSLSSGLAYSSLDALLISGKRGGLDGPTKLEDGLYVLDAQGQYVDKFYPEFSRTNGRLVQDSYGWLYQINHVKGLVRLSDSNCVIPPACFPIDTDPRYNANADVLVGLTGEGIDWAGRPILDAAFDTDANYVYIVPVVVSPNDPNAEPYEAAAKLQLLDTGNPPYRVVQLYDDLPPLGDNQHRNNLREIEIDSAGNLYVVNADTLNESDILWVFDADTGAIKSQLGLGDPNSNSYLPMPVGMHMSNTTGMLYLASSLNDPNANSVSLYALSVDDLNSVEVIDINDMGHITDITEDPTTGTLWVVGFTMPEIPEYLELYGDPFYKPYLAKIPCDSNETVQAVCLSDPVLYPDNDLALPLSIVWTGPKDKCVRVDIDGSGEVNLADFAPFAAYWLEMSCGECGGIDFTGDENVTIDDLQIFCDCWLWQGP